MSSTLRCLKYAVLPRSSLYSPVAQIIRTPDADATSAMKFTSRPMSIGHGSTNVSRPRSRTSLSRSTQFLSADLRSNFGAAQSSSQPAHPISRCSCIRVVPSCSGLTVPVTVLIAFIAMRSRVDPDFDFSKLDPPARRRQMGRAILAWAIWLGLVVAAEERRKDDHRDADRDSAVRDVEDWVV